VAGQMDEDVVGAVVGAVPGELDAFACLMLHQFTVLTLSPY
jgi:hypothetical protein